MTEEQQPDPGPAQIEHILEFCRLEVPEERRPPLAEALAGFQEDIRRTDAIDVSEVILGSVFDARWS